MSVLERIGEGFEQVVFCHDPGTGLRAIVAIHSTRLGPALGGTRFRPYPTTDEALADVLRLARGMTAKAAVAGVPFGGGKAVIIGDPTHDRTDDLIAAYGAFVGSLGGRYLTAEDVGTTQADMDLIRGITPAVTGTSEALGGSGDPSPATAWGVLCAMRAVAAHLWGSPSLERRHVTVAGVGKVGAALVGHLADEGARVTVADPRSGRTAWARERHGAHVVHPGEIHRIEADIHAPCALGASLDRATIPELGAPAVCGSANNQLAEPDDAERLACRGVLYAPDYVVNAGGIINIAEERTPAGYDRARALDRVAAIEHTTAEVLAAAQAEGVTTAEAADRLARRRLEAAPWPGIRSFPAAGEVRP